jgi:hypothetical protein
VPVNNVIPQDQVAQAIIAASPYLAAGLDDGCRALLDELTGDGADPAARVREASAEDMPLWPDDIALPGLISAAVGGRNLVTGVDVLSNKLAFAREVSAADLENLTAQSDREIAAIAAETGRALCAAHQRIDISEVSPSTSTTPTAASTRVAPLTIPGGPGDSAPSLRLMVDALGMAYSIGVSNMGPALPAECTTEVIRLSCESDRKR